METLSEDFARTDLEAQMTVLTCEDITVQDPDIADEVEDLRNSLREAVHDEAVRPKMQCLMMDPSFSMVTMQGEDSGIEWETSPSRCTTPWASEAGNPQLEFSFPLTVRPPTPGSLPAGRIIIVMDEEKMSRKKKTKEGVCKHRVKADQQELLEGLEGISRRPELVGVSLPNVKTDGDGNEGKVKNSAEDIEQQLFCLVAEGSEILNIVVPPELATVDEEESTVMVDNLSYLQQSLIIKSIEETNVHEIDPNNEMTIPTQAPGGGGQEAPNPAHPNVMDPPGAPVTRPQNRGAAASNVDYFEKFTLIDVQAPGSPAVTALGQTELSTTQERAGEIQATKEPTLHRDNKTHATVHLDEGSMNELTSELLDDVFYGSTDDGPIRSSLDKGEECKLAERVASRVPSKESGLALFGSQEDILTPVFLPEGPPKVIDQILLEEPKAMAFLYTDLYEEAIGSREKDEDATSVTSEKSFHSQHSDREARGYLEKYVLKDETPVLEMETAKKEEPPVEGARLLSQDSHYMEDFLPSPEKADMPDAEEEITDFFRSSANCSPCDIEPFALLTGAEDEAPSCKESKSKARKDVSQATVKFLQPSTTIPDDVVENIGDDASRDDVFPEDSGWESETESVLYPGGGHNSQELGRPTLEAARPVAPPRRKATAAPKTSLDLTPLLPVEAKEEAGETTGGKEHREEEKETASPAETDADEGEGDEEAGLGASSREASIPEVTDRDNVDVDRRDMLPAQAEENSLKTEEDKGRNEAGKDEHTGQETTDITSAGSPESQPEKQGGNVPESTAEEDPKSPVGLVTEPSKEGGQCIIV